MREFTGRPGRLDLVVAEALAAPRAEAQRAIQEGRVLVEGHPRPKSFRLAGGERVRVDLPASRVLQGEAPPVVVRYEDPYLLVVSKPGGLPTHPTQAKRSGTLVNRLIGMGVPLSGVSGVLRPGIVHRLDAGTSGLLVVAKDDETHLALGRMFSARRIGRLYLALVRGDPPYDRFDVRAPLGRRGARIVVQETTGRGAETSFMVRERFRKAALLEAAPRTGRTHQIRVHLSSVGHPILGDRAYRGGGDDASRLGLSRPFLHAFRLFLEHPRTGDPIDVREDLPRDLEVALERIRREG